MLFPFFVYHTIFCPICKGPGLGWKNFGACPKGALQVLAKG